MEKMVDVYKRQFNAVYQLSDEAYMYACPEAVEDLQTSEIPVRAIAWARLNTAPNNGSWWGITFIVEEEQDVTLGFQANLMMGRDVYKRQGAGNGHAEGRVWRPDG